MISPALENRSKGLPDLIVVMPVYNEQASVRKVVQEWFTEIENWTENFIIVNSRTRRT